jgi:hypothetical protein
VNFWILINNFDPFELLLVRKTSVPFKPNQSIHPTASGSASETARLKRNTSRKTQQAMTTAERVADARAAESWHREIEAERAAWLIKEEECEIELGSRRAMARSI